MERSTSGGGDGRRARPTAHELARYEALFAARTRGMKSSAMREMMALTERPDVISLAGGLPDTSTFPPELYAGLMADVASESTARALQYGPDRRDGRDGRVHRRGDGGRGHGDRPLGGDRDHGRSAGDRPRLQDADRSRRRDRGRGPDLPRGRADVQRLPGRGRADRDRRRRHADRRAREHARPPAGRGPAPEVHLHDPQLPEPGRRDDVARPAPAAGRGRARARAAGARGQPVRPAPLRGRAAADALLARRGGGRARAARRTSSSTWAPSPRSSRPACGSDGRSPRARCWRS